MVNNTRVIAFRRRAHVARNAHVTPSSATPSLDYDRLRESLAAAGAGYAAGAATAPQTGRTPQFDNAQAKVWKSLIMPNSPLPFHRHDHPRALIALQGGTMKILDEDGTSEIHEWKAGNAYWLPANAPGTRHQDVNVGTRPIEVIVVELSKES